MVKLADTLDLGSSASRRGGSSPSRRTNTFGYLISRYRISDISTEFRSYSRPFCFPIYCLTDSTDASINHVISLLLKFQTIIVWRFLLGGKLNIKFFLCMLITGFSSFAINTADADSKVMLDFVHSYQNVCALYSNGDLLSTLGFQANFPGAKSLHTGRNHLCVVGDTLIACYDSNGRTYDNDMRILEIPKDLGKTKRFSLEEQGGSVRDHACHMDDKEIRCWFYEDKSIVPSELKIALPSGEVPVDFVLAEGKICISTNKQLGCMSLYGQQFERSWKVADLKNLEAFTERHGGDEPHLCGEKDGKRFCFWRPIPESHPQLIRLQKMYEFLTIQTPLVSEMMNQNYAHFKHPGTGGFPTFCWISLDEEMNCLGTSKHWTKEAPVEIIKPKGFVSFKKVFPMKFSRVKFENYFFGNSFCASPLTEDGNIHCWTPGGTYSLKLPNL